MNTTWIGMRYHSSNDAKLRGDPGLHPSHSEIVQDQGLLRNQLQRPIGKISSIDYLG